MRQDGRSADELRPLTFQRHFNDKRPGSVLVSCGSTKVLCTASVEDGVPNWMKPLRKGLAHRRVLDASGFHGSAQGARRSHRQSRLAQPRDLAAHRSRHAHGRRPQAASRTRPSGSTATSCKPTAAHAPTAINGAYVALHDALAARSMDPWPITTSIAAISVGSRQGSAPCSISTTARTPTASVDLNIAMTGEGKFIELQGTGEVRTVRRRRTPGDAAPRAPGRRVHHDAPADGVRRIRQVILLGTGNPKKAAEMRNILMPLGVRGVIAVALPDVVEDGDTFQENARKKALEFAAYCKGPVLADDSGLVVPALNGEPGVLLRSLFRRGRHRRAETSICCCKESAKPASTQPDAYFACCCLPRSSGSAC